MKNMNNSELFVLRTALDCFLLIFASKNPDMIQRFFSAIIFKIHERENSLKIKLRSTFPVAPEKISSKQPLKEKFSFMKFINFLQKFEVKKIQISTEGFNFNGRSGYSFLLNLLLSMTSITHFELFIKDKEPIILDQLIILIYAGLHSPENLLQLSLNFAYGELSLKAQEDLTRVLQAAAFRAGRLEKLELKAYGENWLFAKIIEDTLSAGTGLANSLQGLVLECQNFSGGKAVLVRIYGSYPNLKKLKIKAYDIDIDDETVLVFVRNLSMIANLKSLHLSLRNKQVGDESVRRLLRVLRANSTELKDLMIDLEGSKVSVEAFAGLVQERFAGLEKAEKFPFGLEHTNVLQEYVDLLIYLYEAKKNGQNVDAESSDRTVIVTSKNY